MKSDEIKQEAVNWIQIRRFLKSASMKLVRARDVLVIDEQAGFQMAYEAMLRASLAFMLSLGKRPRSTLGHHRIIIDFVSDELGSDYTSLMRAFDLMRRKRNEALYEPLSTITSSEADNAVTVAKKFFRIIMEHIRHQNPQQRLF